MENSRRNSYILLLGISKKKNAKMSRFWAFTLNNYTDEECLHIEHNVVPLCNMVRIGKEIAPTTGTPHLQGMLGFAEQKRFKAVKNLLPPRASEIASMYKKSSDAKLGAYCSKENLWISKGEPTGVTGVEAGATWKESAMALVKEGLQWEEAVERDPRLFDKQKVYNVWYAVKMPRSKRRTEKRIVYWIHGTGGAGKTKWVADHSDDRAVPVTFDSRFLAEWEYVRKDSSVVIDEFDNDSCYVSNLLRMLDPWYDHAVAVKNGSFFFQCPIVYVCTTWHPKDQELPKSKTIIEITRRITHRIAL